MNYKLKFLFGVFILPVFLGAGCATSAPQATIADPMVGDAAAPVQIAEYYDFQCPTCKVASEAVISFIIEDYVDSGKAAITFKDMAFIGTESQTAGLAGFCAAEQEKFYDYYKAVFAAQGAENSGAFSAVKLKGLAAEAGLDTEKFNSCFDSGKYRDRVKKSTNDAFAAGIYATPTFVINGQVVQSGTYLSIKRVIDKKLQEAGLK